MPDSQPMTEAMYYILLALLEPNHGYGLMQRIREISEGRLLIGPGTLYGVLNRMKSEGWIKLESQEERRKTYVMTEAGREALHTEYTRLTQMVRDGAALGESV